MRKWSIDDSAELYNINGWGLNYFSINEKGHVAVTPKTDGPSIDLKELMEELQVRDVEAPVLLRFPDILDNRIEKISNCFQAAAREYGYSAKNFIIYPIKVLSLKRLSVMGINSISVWKQARSQSCMRYFRSISMMRP